MKKIRDTLIGLWPVIKTYVPKPGLIIAVVVAFLIGLIWSYAIDPLAYYDADPSKLGQSWQDEWVRLVAERYDFANSNRVVNDEFRNGITNLLRAVDNPQEVTSRVAPQLNDLALAAEQQGTAVAPNQPTIVGQIRPWLLGPIVVALGFVIGSLLYGFYFQPIVVEPIRKRLRGAQGTDAAGAGKIQDIQQARQLRDQLAKDAAAAPATDLGPPVVRHVSIYTPGRAYDDSFSIEDASKDDEFLGECGATISETIGVGQPEKVTAVEIWLFDKEDFVRTLTTVFVSEHAFNDPAIRGKLSSKGDLIVAKPGAVAKLETNTLRLQARIVDIAYGTGPLPPNSYFDKMTVEIQAWRKAPGSAPAPSAPAATVPVYSPPPVIAAPTFAPTQQAAPPPSPFPAQQPARPMPPTAPSFGGSVTPLRPPPIQQPPRQPDDDPFGGSGDFTPVN